MEHGKPIFINCKICGKQFGNKSNYKTHVNAVHENLKPFKCNFCSTEFGIQGNMDRHIRTVHKKENEASHLKI